MLAKIPMSKFQIPISKFQITRFNTRTAWGFEKVAMREPSKGSGETIQHEHLKKMDAIVAYRCVALRSMTKERNKLYQQEFIYDRCGMGI